MRATESLTREQRVRAGERIKWARTRNGWSQSQVAIAARVSRSTVAHVEYDQGAYSFQAVFAIAAVVGLTRDMLYGECKHCGGSPPPGRWVCPDCGTESPDA